VDRLSHGRTRAPSLCGPEWDDEVAWVNPRTPPPRKAAALRRAESQRRFLDRESRFFDGNWYILEQGKISCSACVLLGLDLGASKVVAVVAVQEEDGTLNVTGTGQASPQAA